MIKRVVITLLIVGLYVGLLMVGLSTLVKGIIDSPEVHIVQDKGDSK